MNVVSPPSGARKFLYLNGLLLALILPWIVGPVNAATDTTWSVTFRLNMTKAIRQQVFDPETGHIHLIADHGLQPLLMVRGAGEIYTATLSGDPDTGATYHYSYRISDTLAENVTRTFTTRPGAINLTDWWNNDPLNITTFRVNMAFAAASSRFNPETDSVCISGTPYGTQGSPRLARSGSSLFYTRVDSALTPGAVHEYKYRINAGDAGLELSGKPPRIFRVPDTLLFLDQDFDNFNPARQPMTFRCNLRYYLSQGLFDPASDYLDVAGNFNGQGGYDLLFDTDGDSVYTLELYPDTAWFTQGPLSFKFRINGDWNSAELAGKPFRTYVFHDTLQGANVYTCHFNDQDPSVLTPPKAVQVAIQGPLVYKKHLSGIYSYENVNGIPEGISAYQWYRCDNPAGTGAIPIDSARKITYTVDTLDISKWLIFEVTPKAAWGDSATGQPVRVISASNISAWDVGMGENGSLIRRIYPNPATDRISFVAGDGITFAEIRDPAGRVLHSQACDGTPVQILPVGQLPPGLYLLRVGTAHGQTGTGRFVKLPE